MQVELNIPLLETLGFNKTTYPGQEGEFLTWKGQAKKLGKFGKELVTNYELDLTEEVLIEFCLLEFMAGKVGPFVQLYIYSVNHIDGPHQVTTKAGQKLIRLITKADIYLPQPPF